MHGLVMGLPSDHLIEVSNKSGIVIGYYWPKYSKHFGFNRLEKIRSSEMTANYLVKNITIENLNTVVAANSNLYYCSNGLDRAEVIYKGFLCKELDDVCFENEFAKKQIFNDLYEAQSYFV